MILRYEVVTSDGRWRRFTSWDEAERWARRSVAQSADEQHACNASIYSDESGEIARVVLDGNNRVWTDMTWASSS